MAEPKPTMLDPDDDDFDYKEPSETEGPDDHPVEEGAILNGTIVKAFDDHLLVDFGWKTEGVLPYREVREGKAREGEDVTVKVVQENYEEEAPLLSEKQALSDRAWSRIQKAQETGETIEGLIFKKIKGGFLVRLFDFLTAFMPQSHLSLSRKSNYDRFLNKRFEMKVLECSREEDNVVVSRREHLEEKRKDERETFFKEHEEGEWVKGTVKNIVNFGAFIDLGPVDGLLHKSDVAWGSVRDVEDYLTMGDEVEVKILNLQPDEGKVSLGRKQKYEDPWKNIGEKYEEGEVTTGEVVDVWSDGVFVRLERDVEGKIPEDELAWTRTWDHPKDQFHENEKIKIKVLDIDPERRRMELSAKAIESNPWDILEKRFPKGTVLSAPVVDIKKDFINVQLLKNVKGIIRKSNIKWGDQDVDLFDYFSIGEKVKCKVLELDPDEQRVELGIKQTMPDPWVKKARQYPKGTTVEGTVTSVLQFGAFVEIDDGLEGLVHVSEMGEAKRVNPHEEVSEGDTVGVKVLSIDEDEHKIDLSIQAYKEEMERQQMEEYMEKQQDGSSETGDMTFGDLLGDDLQDVMKE